MSWSSKTEGARRRAQKRLLQSLSPLGTHPNAPGAVLHRMGSFRETQADSVRDLNVAWFVCRVAPPLPLVRRYFWRYSCAYLERGCGASLWSAAVGGVSRRGLSPEAPAKGFLNRDGMGGMGWRVRGRDPDKI